MTTQNQDHEGWPVPADLTATRFEKASINLFDLFRESFRAGQPMVTDRKFVNCRLEGPAVIAVLDGCSFDRVDFGYPFGGVGSMVIRSAKPGKIIGALPFGNCEFVDCQFFATGFTGPEPFLAQLLALDENP